MADIDIRLTGFERIEERMRKIPDEVRRQAVPKALRAAAIMARRAIRNATPVGPTGNLRRSTTFRIRRYNRVAVAVIGHRWGPGSHAHLIELGTQERERETIGGSFAWRGAGDDPRNKGTGRGPATHFMARAFRAVEGRLTILYAKTLLKEADRLMGKQ